MMHHFRSVEDAHTHKHTYVGNQEEEKNPTSGHDTFPLLRPSPLLEPLIYQLSTFF